MAREMDCLPPSVGNVESCGFVHSPLFSAPHLVRYSNNTMLTSYASRFERSSIVFVCHMGTPKWSQHTFCCG
jgi:hypothetical protein